MEMEMETGTKYVIDYVMNGRLWATDFNSPCPPKRESASIPPATKVESIDHVSTNYYVVNLTYK